MVEAKSAHGADSEEVVGRPEAARGHVAFVLDGVVAAGWREICGAASVIQCGHPPERERGAPWTMMEWWCGRGWGGRGGWFVARRRGGVVRRKVTRMQMVGALGAFSSKVCHSTTDKMEVSMDSEQLLPKAGMDLDTQQLLPLPTVAFGKEGGEEAMVDVAAEESKPISKNQQKKLAKLKHYAETREQWRNEKRDKKRAAKERKRQAQNDSSGGLKRKADVEENEEGDGVDSVDGSVEGSVEEPTKKKQKTQPKRVLEPITFIMDCGFDEKMNDKVRPCPLLLVSMLNSAAGNHLHVLSAHALLRRQPALDKPGHPPRHLPQWPTSRALPDRHQQPAPALEGRQVLRHGLRGHRREQGRPDIPDRGLARHGRGPGGWQELHYRRDRRQESVQSRQTSLVERSERTLIANRASAMIKQSPRASGPRNSRSESTSKCPPASSSPRTRWSRSC